MDSKNSKNSISSRTDECAICLQTTDSRGGVAIFSPGCCGKWYHQGCIDEMLRTGNNLCPNCRVVLPVSVPILPTFTIPIDVALVHQTPMITVPDPVIFPEYFPAINPPQAPNVHNSLESDNFYEDSLDKQLIEKMQINLESNNETVPPFIILCCSPEKNELSLLEADPFFVNINLKASKSTKNQRMPMDIVCVLDNSSSMQGMKLNSVKLAMQFVTRQLNSSDRLSIITFNSSATVTHGLYTMNEERKAQSGNLVRQIKAGGGTDIYSGLTYGVNILDQRKEVNKLSCIFLLTDGEDSSHMREKLDLSKRIRNSGYSLFVFGFGRDHDSKQLESIANAAEASFLYVEEDSMIVDAFGGTLGGQGSVFAKDLHLTVEIASTPSNNGDSKIECRQAFSGQYLSTISPSRTLVEVHFANLFHGETRDVLISLKIPAVDRDILKYLLLTAHATYKDVENNEKHALAVPQELYDTLDTIAATPPDSTASTTATCHITRSAAPNPKENLQVDAQKNRMLLTLAITNATKKADEGDFESAKLYILGSIENVKMSSSRNNGNYFSDAVLEELEVSVLKVSNQHEYNELGGDAELRSRSNRWNKQRSTYNSASSNTDDDLMSPIMFQSPTSSIFQSSAKRFKTDDSKLIE